MHKSKQICPLFNDLIPFALKTKNFSPKFSRGDYPSLIETWMGEGCFVVQRVTDLKIKNQFHPPSKTPGALKQSLIGCSLPRRSRLFRGFMAKMAAMTPRRCLANGIDGQCKPEGSQLTLCYCTSSLKRCLSLGALRGSFPNREREYGMS